jgi:hypothetical protein
MFHMLTCFDLKPEYSLDEFQESLDEYTNHMHSLDLVEDRSPIGLRQSDTIMDTDNERNHKYFMLMNFRDRTQSDKAVEYINKEVYSKVQDLIFICWQDI